mgnify:CR=1 FL=1
MNIISTLKPSIKFGLSLLLAFVLQCAYAFQPEGAGVTSASNDDFLPVEEAYIANVFSDNGEIIVDWQMAPNYYLYEHAFSIQANTTKLNINYSRDGIARHDEYFGDVTVFYDNLQLAASSDTKTITVNSQGCADAGLCYPPRSQHFYFDASSDRWIEGLQKIDAVDADAIEQVAPPSLIKLILLAFIGGLILNLMPCVLPVLTLKSLSFAKQQKRSARIRHGWAYTAGVLCSFTFIAGLLLILKASGQAIGWGFQLQSPFVIAALVYVFFLMALSLLDAFHFKGLVISSTGDNTDSTFNSFSTGVLACIVASPCTAPFMGTAIASALTLATLPALLIFVSLGFGMAAPFLLLSYSPSTARFLPKPGQWMNSLKQFLAFPLFGTCIWLITIANAQSGVTSVAVLLTGCTLLAMAAWWRKTLGLLSLIALIVIATVISVQFKPSDTEQANAFSLNALDQLITKEPSVFVNVTASWCISCKANEIVLHSDDMQELFSTTNTQYIEADWTAPNADISRLLERHQRNGIPLYLLYRNGNITTPAVLPQFLNKTILTSALAQKQ